MLDHFDIDTLRDRVERELPWRDMPGVDVDLGAGLELALAINGWRALTDAPSQLRNVEAWAAKVEVLAAADLALRGIEADVPMYDAPMREFMPLGARATLIRAGGLFFDRFARSLRSHARLASATATAIARAAYDMADNAIQHSGSDDEHPASGAVGFEVVGTRLSFAVADTGRGVLASLKSSARWAHLASQRDALDLAVLKNASRRGNGQGYGFRDLLNALADQSGSLRFASDDAVLGLDGTSQIHRTRRTAKRRALPGFQLSATMEATATI
ncbi:MAG: hypothetical protein ABL886_02685 [Rhodoglobus sp.]